MKLEKERLSQAYTTNLKHDQTYVTVTEAKTVPHISKLHKHSPIRLKLANNNKSLPFAFPYFHFTHTSFHLAFIAHKDDTFAIPCVEISLPNILQLKVFPNKKPKLTF